VGAASNNVDEIRHQMSQTRRVLLKEVRESVDGSVRLYDWRRYVRMFPWAVFGSAVAAGYWIVPKRNRTAPADFATEVSLPEVRGAIAETRGESKDRAKTHQSPLSTAWEIALPVVIRAAQGYAAHWLEQFVMRQQVKAQTSPSPPPSSAGSGRPEGEHRRSGRVGTASDGIRPDPARGGSHDESSYSQPGIEPGSASGRVQGHSARLRGTRPRVAGRGKRTGQRLCGQRTSRGTGNRVLGGSDSRIVGQAKVNGGSATRSQGDKNASAEGMVGNVAEIANDVLTLAEFQAKLAALDFREAAGKAAVPIGLTMAGLVLLAASLPVVLLSLAWLLATALQIHVGWAMLMTASVAMALAGIAGGFGATRLIRSFDSFRRSQEELSRNLSWVRTVLRYRGQDDDRSQSDLSKSAHGRSPGSGH
jgi:uncharacterized membrane protein YqjE